MQERFPNYPLRETTATLRDAANSEWNKFGLLNSTISIDEQIKNLFSSELKLCNVQHAFAVRSITPAVLRKWELDNRLLTIVLENGIRTKEGRIAAYQWFAYQTEILIDRLSKRNCIGLTFIFSSTIHVRVEEQQRRYGVCKSLLCFLAELPTNGTPPTSSHQ